MNHHFLLVIHLICAAIWVGGHLLLVFAYLPKAIKEKNQQIILEYEKKYEPVGMPALALLVITGIMMAYKYGVGIESWFHFESPVERVVSVKLALLFLTVLFALSAQFRVIPKLEKNKNKLTEMSLHIIAVTLIGVVMLIMGSFVRFGGI